MIYVLVFINLFTTMQKLVFKEIAQKSLKELISIRSQLKKDLYELKMKNSMRWLKQTHLLKIARRNLAKINTALNHKVNYKDGGNMK